jgi:citrate synthase
MSKGQAMRQDNRYLTAHQAAAALGVSPATLYSYVSRGMLHSEAVTGKPRERRYPADDIARLVEGKEFRRNPARAAARGLHWGSPVLESSLTLINEGRLFYRGLDALELAQHATFEEIAALLWTGDARQADDLFPQNFAELPPSMVSFMRRASHLGPIERCQVLLPFAAASDAAAYDLRPRAVAKTGARILRLLLFAVCRSALRGPVETVLADTWTRSPKSSLPALRAALILCADHELNVSAFTARSIASAGATPYEVVTGALAAFRGHRHGGASEQVEALFREAEHTRRCHKILADRLRLFEGLPGFGHRLYPEGDPRASLLISLARTQGRSSVVETANGLTRTAQSLTGESPNLDFGLVTLARSLDLPPGSAMALFALGRTVGWIAHAIEQYGDNQLIRPRARYVGPPPESTLAEPGATLGGRRGR